MKKSLLIIPVIVVILLLAGVAVWKMMLPQAPPPVVTRGPLPSAVGKAGGGKPANPFSGLFIHVSPTPTVIPTPTPASVSAMNADVTAIADDGGAADFASLQKDVSGL